MDHQDHDENKQEEREISNETLRKWLTMGLTKELAEMYLNYEIDAIKIAQDRILQLKTL